MLKYGMKERYNIIEDTNDFDNSIHQIIVETDFRRRHGRSLDGESIRERIYSLDYKKPGEYIKFMDEYEASEGRLTTNLALKMAGITYYTSQENCPRDVKPIAGQFEEKLGIDHNLAQQFCILKYRCRLEQPVRSKDYKQKEYQAMSQFLNHRKLNFLP